MHESEHRGGVEKFDRSSMSARQFIFVTADECVALGLKAGALVFRNVTVEESPADLRAAMASAVDELRDRFADAASISRAPELDAFLQIYASVGVKTNRERPACLRLVENAWKRGRLPAINNLVDIYNLVSIRRLLSLGAHDLDRIALPVHLRTARGGEAFVPLGSEKETRVGDREFVYADAAGSVLCRLDLIQADRSKITTSTTNVMVIVQGTTSHTEDKFEAARSDLVEGVSRWCGGQLKHVVWPS